MADDIKKIIFQIEVDQSKGLQAIVDYKANITKLKEEQKALNTTTLEGKKQFEAYNAQIKALTKEQKSLENSIEKTAASFQLEEGSIAKNRAELSRLTAEYIKLGNPTKEQTKKIKDLTDRLKEQESAIGNNSRNVGNYKEAIQDIAGSTGLFGAQLGQAQNSFKGLQSGLGTVAKGFGTLRGAIISTGIGALIIALISLIQYFTSTDTGATQLAGVMGGLGAIVRKVTGFFAGLGKGIVDVVDGTKSLGDVFKDLGDIIVQNVINRLKAPLVILEAIQEAFTELAENGLDADLTPALKKATDGIIQLNTGIADGTDKIAEFSKEVAEAAKEAYDYALAIDDIDDRQRELNVTNAKANQQVEILLKQARNRTLTEEQRIAILQKASAIEESSTQKQIALDRERLKLIQERNARELAAINQAAEGLDIADDLAQEEADLRKKIIDEETAFLKLKEKNQGTIDGLREAAAERDRKILEERLARERALAEAEANLETQRIAIKIRNLDIELQKEGQSYARRKELLEQRAALEIELSKKSLDLALSNENLLTAQRTALIEERAQKEIEIENNKNIQIALLDDKARQEQEKKDKESAQRRQKAFQDIVQAGTMVLNSIASIQTEQSEKALARLDEMRAEELEKAGDDKEKQAKINKKYDKLAKEEQKNAARQAFNVQQGQAIINTATAVTQALATPAGPPLSFILAGLTGAAGAVQLGVIQSQKNRLAEGGFVDGPSHAQGGVTGTGRFNNVEVEGGEFVINKYATRKHLPLIEAINSDGRKGRMRGPLNLPHIPIQKFATGGYLDGGFAARNMASQAQQRFEQSQDIEAMLLRLPAPIVRVTEINEVNGNLVKVSNRADIG